ncbi:sugar phosphate nucleotidyltransferase [Ihubacter massiliensis]|uniref:Sugar phosphate nucleotidyltransferase n=1 Tax=Hominibacterium faecale TaxID=2839743 RepID=A0A9J6QJL9_9FIRM|nr:MULTISPECIES: sugar phosphate nucleotidyltransferase [Eubacteriales Family XIII. Incertae Sedis]MCO7123061.1 sugar phosphate nucleotidyltransferase [Ihubacter massiliensis]MCU7377321.1 sugar phosphate nucleotidyltransferase [Hominibacterium faecale]
MKEPTLIIMAAGIGSRYGGLKQMDPISDQGEIILDFSLYDAMMAGFKKVIFVIKEEMEEDFRALIDDRAGKHLQVEYAFQKLEDLPQGYLVPQGREKPWGTAHAVLSCRHLINGPFAVINADDYYGAGGFQSIYDFLISSKDGATYSYCMVGFKLENTITENGHVARGVCEITEEGNLTQVTERTKIMRRPEGVCYTEDDGQSWIPLPDGTTVSMNFWGFTKSMMEEMEKGFPAFLDQAIKENPLKGEYYLPMVADRLVKEGKATVKVLPSQDKWYGVTYRADKEQVVAALQSMKDKGLYPDKLWK